MSRALVPIGILLFNTLILMPAPAAVVAQRPVADNLVEFVMQIDQEAASLMQVVDVAVAPNGDIWVVDAPAHRIHIFDSAGSRRETWGTTGSGEGEFNFGPNAAVMLGGAGNAYVMDRGNNRVQKFDSERRFVTAWGGVGTGDGQFLDGRMSDLTVDPAGNVYVLDYLRRDIQKFAADGTFLARIDGSAPGERFSEDVARIGIDVEGNLYVPEASRVHKFAPDGALLLTIGDGRTGEGQIGYAIDAAGDGVGNIFVSDVETGRVQVFDAGGRLLAAWGSKGSDPGQFTGVEALALDGAGHLYVIDYGNNRVQQFRLLPPLAPEAGTPGP